MIYTTIFICAIIEVCAGMGICPYMRWSPLRPGLVKPKLSSIYRCDANCSTLTNCLAFTFNSTSGLCQYSRSPPSAKQIHSHRKDANELWCSLKNCPRNLICYIGQSPKSVLCHKDAKCRKPPRIRHTVVTFEGQFLGAIATYSCSDLYQSCGKRTWRLKCGRSGKWVGQRETCRRNSWVKPRRFKFPIPCASAAKWTLDLTGMPTARTRFATVIRKYKTILAWIEVRFVFGNVNNTFLINSQLGQGWGKEQLMNTFPFQVNRLFNITVVYTGTGYQIKAGGKFVTFFKERHMDIKPESISILYDVKIHFLSINGAN